MNVLDICKKAKENNNYISQVTLDERNKMLEVCQMALLNNIDYIILENAKDIENSKDKPSQFIDRLALNEKRIKDMVEGLEKLKILDCPVGEILENYDVPTGLNITKIRVPLGTIGIIYEARPNVTCDAIGLCIKSGNAVVLRGSSSAIFSNKCLVEIIKNELNKNEINSEFIQFISDPSRDATMEFMKMKGYVDVLMPRGGASLIKSTVENSIIPVIETGSGNCHLYVDEFADFDKAINICLNAKVQRPSVCNSIETLLIHEKIAKTFLPIITKALIKNNVEIRACEECLKLDSSLKLASDEDYFTEYSAYIIAIKIVKDVVQAVQHINKYSTNHSESIITESKQNAEFFLLNIDSAAVYHNVSTRFTDGFEFGLGAEMGISTQKLHARGPMGLKELTSYKFIIRGDGVIRK